MAMKTAILAAASALIFMASPAWAADPATLSCVTKELPPEAREDFVFSAQTLAGSGKVHEVADENRASLDKAVETCRKRHNWSADAADAAKYFAMSDMALAEVRKSAVAAGVDVDAVARAVADLTPQQRAGLGESNDDAIAALIAAYAKHNIDVENEAQQPVLFIYTIMLARHIGERDRFAAS